MGFVMKFNYFEGQGFFWIYLNDFGEVIIPNASCIGVGIHRFREVLFDVKF